MPQNLSLSLLALPALPEGSSLQGQMMMLCGFVVLAWVLVRRTIRAKRRQRGEAAQWTEHQRQADARSGSAVPLADAPPETLRWQAAMFDLQRELKAELETKISVLQAMVQMADQRIATLQELSPTVEPPTASAAPPAVSLDSQSTSRDRG